MKLVLASANPDKSKEITELLADVKGLELLERPLDVPDVVEDGETLEDNARLKAAAIASATGLPAVADDTGLVVDALGGAPGVMTARYAGESATYADNVAKMLAALGEAPDRHARFVTVALLRFPDGRELVAEGAVDGKITTSAKGRGGFGYDPIFVPLEGDGRTFAEMTTDEKHELSHRARAFRALGDMLEIS